jgi:hypothetical protein
MKATLKQGVQIVSAPQLFPTPPELAARMVELARVSPQSHVLEPSAGTGVLVRALRDKGASVYAVELQASLAELAPSATSRAERVSLLALPLPSPLEAPDEGAIFGSRLSPTTRLRGSWNGQAPCTGKRSA